jgi:hypothetical protein
MVRPTTVVVALLLALAVTGAAACAIVPASPLAPSSADGTVRFTGSVINLSSGAIAGAKLTIVTGVDKDAQVTTGADGHYVFAGLQPDGFSVLIEASGFTSITPRVNLFTDVDATFALSAN